MFPNLNPDLNLNAGSARHPTRVFCTRWPVSWVGETAQEERAIFDAIVVAAMKKGIQLSKMIVNSTHSESGCHEDIMLLSREIHQHYFLVPVLF
jgi:hypothetical protein